MQSILSKNISNFLVQYLLPLFICLLAIIIELSLTKISFIAEVPPSFLLMIIFYWIISLKVDLSYWLIFLLGLIWDVLVGSIPGLMTSSLLISIGCLKLIINRFTFSSYVTYFFGFSLFLLFLNFVKLIGFSMLYFSAPSYEKIIFQLCFSLVIFPFILILLNPIKILFSIELEELNE